MRWCSACRRGAAFAGRQHGVCGVNGTVRPEQLARFLEANGYGRAGTVMEPGEYAMRGGIIDLFPAGEPDPVRLDLFGDTIEIDPRVRSRQPAQRPSARRAAADAAAGVGGAARRDAVARFRSGWRELFGQAAADDPIYQSISDGRRHPGMEHWVPLFHDGMETLLDYLPGASVSLDHQADEVLTARLEMIADHFAARRGTPRDGEVPYRPLPPDRLYLDRAGWDAMLAGGPLFAFSAVRAARGCAPASMAAAGRGRSSPSAQPAACRASTCSTSCAAQAERWADEGRRHRRRRLDARLARAPGQPAARARLQRRGAGGRLGGGAPQAGRVRVAGHARRGARLRRRRAAWRWWASRTCWASASPARRGGASGPTSSSPRPPRSPRATWWCTRNTASAATTGWRR